MAELTVKAIRDRRKAAQSEKDSFSVLLNEVYEYAIPYRKSVKETGTGSDRVSRVFDSTAIISAFRFAGRVQNDIVPPGFFALEPGPLVPKDQRAELAQKLQPIAEVVNGTFLSGEWDQAVHEMGIDLGAGTGAILSLPGDETKVIRDIAVSIDELLLESGPYNDISGIFWVREWTVRAVEAEFPEGKFSADWLQQYKEPQDKEKKVKLYQDTVWNTAKKRWCRYVWAQENGDDTFIAETETRTCPWTTPRYFRVPGETYGRGPIMLALPTIRTLNVAQKIMLQAAALAMLGVYTAVDDGVFNPDNAPLNPGAFWKVARNGGSLGPSVQRFPDPRIDLSGIVVDKLQMAVKQQMNDDALPSDTGAVRSPTEIAERMKRLAFDHLGAFGRLVRELVVPAVQRRIEICFDLGLIQQDIPIDQLLIRVAVKSPMAMAQEADKVQKLLQYIAIVLQIAPTRQHYLIKMDEALVGIAPMLGVAPDLIPTPKERAAMADADQKAAAAAALVQGAAAAAGATTQATGGALPAIPGAPLPAGTVPA